SARRSRIEELANIPATLVFFETGPRIAAMLADVAAGLSGRPAAVCRELTKLHEEIRRGDIAALALAYGDHAETRGEFGVCIGRPAKSERVDAIDLDGILERAEDCIAQGCRRSGCSCDRPEASYRLSARPGPIFTRRR